MFKRRVNIVTVVFLAAGAVLLARLAQVQIGWHDRFAIEDYTSPGGSHITETVRGGIYTRWGTPLARQAASFDLGVHYGRLLLASSKPWKDLLVRRYMDEFLRRSDPAGYGPEYSWDEYARPQGPGTKHGRPPREAQAMDRYEYLWSVRGVESRRHGAMQSYILRRLKGESARSIASSGTPAGVSADWRETVAGLTGVPAAQLTAKAEEIVQQVERIQRYVQRLMQERKGLDPEQNYMRIVEQEQYHGVVAGVATDVAVLVRAEPERFAGIRVLERSARRYPNGPLAPHIVGVVRALSPEQWQDIVAEGRAWTMAMPFSEIGERYKMDDWLGVSGIERAHEDLLRGTRGHVVNRRRFKVLKVVRESIEVPPERGCDVYLTLREDFQRAANDALRRAAETPELAFNSGALVIVDVRDGAVLAAANYPSYDRATYRRDYAQLLADDLTPLFPRARYGALPTGSVYKVITAIAALEEKAITPETTFTCRQIFRAGRASRPFRCTGHHGTLSLLPAIEKSCNIYFYNTGLAAGGEALARWGLLFGLGAPPGELPEPKYTYGVINLSIGQGNIRCTPLQVANAMAAIANDGRLHKTHFFHHAQKLDGTVVEEYRPEFATVPVSFETLRVVREGMRKVIETGTAGNAGLDPFRVAGKTGTAERGADLPNHAWFAGYAPYDTPKIAFAVVSENTPGHGGSHAAPIMRFALEEIWDEVEAMP